MALEPRHASWFDPAADRLVTQYRVARVAADPAVVPAAAEPGGWDGLVYYRLHGSPKVYYSAYPDEYLEALAKTLTRAARSADRLVHLRQHGRRCRDAERARCTSPGLNPSRGLVAGRGFS